MLFRSQLSSQILKQQGVKVSDFFSLQSVAHLCIKKKKKKKHLKYVFLHAYLWHLQKSERSVWKQTAWVLGPGCSRSGLCPRNGFLHKTNDFNTFQEKNRKKTPKCVLKKSSRRLPCFPFIGKSWSGKRLDLLLIWQTPWDLY